MSWKTQLSRPVRQHAEPGLDDKAVTRKAAVAAQQRHRHDVAVPGAQLGAALLRQQFQQRRLALQGLELQVRVRRQRLDLDAGPRGRLAVRAGADGFGDAHPLGQQHVRAQHRAQAQQAIVLPVRAQAAAHMAE